MGGTNIIIRVDKVRKERYERVSLRLSKSLSDFMRGIADRACDEVEEVCPGMDGGGFGCAVDVISESESRQVAADAKKGAVEKKSRGVAARRKEKPANLIKTPADVAKAVEKVTQGYKKIHPDHRYKDVCFCVDCKAHRDGLW